jgi:hypothetical protein
VLAELMIIRSLVPALGGALTVFPGAFFICKIELTLAFLEN